MRKRHIQTTIDEKLQKNVQRVIDHMVSNGRKVSMYWLLRQALIFFVDRYCEKNEIVTD